MNIDPGQPGDREPLTPEERELAQRLSRLGPSAGPPSAIDARILAAAHDAVATRPRKRRAPRRWPMALGVAASLALAVGIAWRLRPLPEQPQLRGESAASAESAAPASAPTTVMAEPSAEIDSQAPAKAQNRGGGETVAQDAAKTQPKQESVPAAPAAETPIVVDEARAFDLAAPPPAPPAPQASSAAAEAASADAAAMSAARSLEERERRGEAARTAQAADTMQRAKSAAAPRPPAAPAPAAAQREQQAFEDIEVVGADNGDEPPAYTNSPQVREAWLQRIRELIAEGDLQQAHDSLQEFQRRYPDQALPDELKRFQQSRPAPLVP